MVMQQNFMNCMESFGKPMSVILTVYSPLNINHEWSQNTNFHIFLLSSTEPVIQNLSISLHIILLHGTVDMASFSPSFHDERFARELQTTETHFTRAVSPSVLHS
jgi:hypothetical protein